MYLYLPVPWVRGGDDLQPERQACRRYDIVSVAAPTAPQLPQQCPGRRGDDTMLLS